MLKTNLLQEWKKEEREREKNKSCNKATKNTIKNQADIFLLGQ